MDPVIVAQGIEVIHLGLGWSSSHLGGLGEVEPIPITTTTGSVNVGEEAADKHSASDSLRPHGL